MIIIFMGVLDVDGMFELIVAELVKMVGPKSACEEAEAGTG